MTGDSARTINLTTFLSFPFLFPLDYAEIAACAATMEPISLSEMSAVRLMNRVDTKFVTTADWALELLRRVSPLYRVQEVDGVRLSPYRTTYFDTAERTQYFQHHNGCAHRTKVRVRTYVGGDDLTFLEVKRKDNHGRTKKKRLLREEGSAQVGWTSAEEHLVSERTGLSLCSMEAVLENRFERVTLVDRGMGERVTVDFGVRFRSPSGVEANVGDVVVVELKRDGRLSSSLLPVLRELRIQPTGFSKCCIGMALTDPGLKQNRFKEKLRWLNKIRTPYD